MQTFLPYPNFAESAKCLDRLRLGKQRVEAYQILRTLLGESTGWRNHPAVLMWKGYEYQLTRYAHDICWEWAARGYKDTVGEKVLDLYLKKRVYDMTPEEPEWLFDEAFHAAHRSNLLRKDPKFYRKYGWTEPADLPYIWPTKVKENE